ncbi:pilus assembly PilX family protein [Roseibacillus persicicus]|uniref:pilus assembly PilX family protein n=1 Tax=Roseibacillus persicicus TaxID=454148 RepID=UPI00280FDC42|nr:hypothetical protein [Roseibacillus persicicus]MDQ8188945.1 hypothetical protein [Roseibacillus persicicus]
MKNPFLLKTARTHQTEAGFSLIITVTMLVLLSLIAVGLLSLSSATLRSSGNEQAFREAQGNARLGLQLAISELQRTMGSDRAVSAPAAAFVAGAAQPHLVGAWESWSWDPLASSGAPDYLREKKDRFRGWLTSRQSSENSGQEVDYAATLPSGKTVELLGEGSYGTMSDEEPVVSELVSLSTEDESGIEKGQYAWTVLSEDTKARIDLIRDEARPNDGEHLASSLTFPERFHRDALELQGYNPSDEKEWARLISSRTLDAAADVGGDNSISQKHFFDFTTYSRGVLSDVRKGGLKRDLTTILEERLLDGERVYSETTDPIGVADPHWSYLSDYYNQYLSFQGGGSVQPIDVTRNITEPRYDANDSSPEQLTLKPVIAKMQIVFSMVTHPLNLKDRHNLAPKYATADRRYAGRHLRPWLVFEPIVTLWNPYSVPIEFESLSIGLDKIPVAFRFGKGEGGEEYDFRVVERGGGRSSRSYWPLSHFVHGGGKNDAISNFSFNIRGGNMAEGMNRDPIVLQPGENKIFSSFVKEGQNWGSVMDDFSIVGSDTVGAGNQRSLIKDVDLVEGWNTVGGFRFDHLSRNHENRNPLSLYPFEKKDPVRSGSYHSVALRPQDSIIVKAKLSNNDANSDSEDDQRQDFTMLVEMDRIGGIESDKILGSSFTVREKELLYEEDADTLIERKFPAVTLLQQASDTTRGGKTPFAVFTMTAKSSRNLLSPTKGWLFGNPVLTAYEQDENEAPQPLQSYEFSFREVNSINSFPMVEIDPNTNRGYFGSGQSAEYGLTATPMFVLPTSPMVSLGQFQAANLISAVKPPFFNYPLGNSFAHPLLDSSSVVSGTFVDHSYLLNQRLWDSFYFSGLSKNGGSSNKRSLEEFFDGNSTLTPRLQPYLGKGRSKEDVVTELAADPDFASREIAASQMLMGPFNIHSTSVKAWKALLLSAFDVSVPTRDANEHEVKGAGAFTRLLPSYSERLGDLERAAGSGDVGNDGLRRAERWLGFHQLTEEKAELLAEQIVEQIKLRCSEDKGPFLSLSEFVNRRVGRSNESFTNRGVLQTAIDLANDPQEQSSQPGEGFEGELFSLEDGVGINNIDARVTNPEALRGNTAEGSPATLIQGDLLQHLGSVISVRSDTFRIRSYGNSMARNGEIQAEAWCEAIVQRVPEFVDSKQTAGTPFDELNPVNQTFGRRFEVVSFRWMTADEV